MNFVRKMNAVWILLALMNLKAFSQSSHDSILCLPINDARAAVKIIEGLRIDSLTMSRNLSVLRTRITQRETTISLLNQRINSYVALTANYDKQIANLNKQNDLSMKLNTTLGKAIKRANTKTILVGIAGLLVSGLTLYLTAR